MREDLHNWSSSSNAISTLTPKAKNSELNSKIAIQSECVRMKLKKELLDKLFNRLVDEEMVARDVLTDHGDVTDAEIVDAIYGDKTPGLE